MSTEMVEVFGTIVAETDSAMLLFDGVTEAWLPLSRIEYDVRNSVGDDLVVEIQEWLAFEKGLI
jgi:hypothetical protein